MCPGKDTTILSEDDSIRNHLLRMLTTRQGAVQTQPLYGLPDINDLTLSRSELAAHICSSIEYCINTFEPRLAQARVESLPGTEDAPLRLNFAIRAQKIGRDGQKTPWSWNIGLSGDSVAEVS